MWDWDPNSRANKDAKSQPTGTPPPADDPNTQDPGTSHATGSTFAFVATSSSDSQQSQNAEKETARATLRASHVAATRLENQAYRSHRKMEALTEQEEGIVTSLNNQSAQSFPRPVSPNIPGVYFVGHHNSAIRFGA
mmetsp:Transcript_22096/g.54618  ORF Transcript_22096/g.54618 Transcript_22096/m.54618 type:complete len:137 (+) Transcript_22096:672-1082(+)